METQTKIRHFLEGAIILVSVLLSELFTDSRTDLEHKGRGQGSTDRQWRRQLGEIEYELCLVRVPGEPFVSVNVYSNQ